MGAIRGRGALSFRVSNMCDSDIELYRMRCPLSASMMSSTTLHIELHANLEQGSFGHRFHYRLVLTYTSKCSHLSIVPFFSTCTSNIVICMWKEMDEILVGMFICVWNACIHVIFCMVCINKQRKLYRNF